jgi:DNA-binding transcriptional LysR family regulator
MPAPTVLSMRANHRAIPSEIRAHLKSGMMLAQLNPSLQRIVVVDPTSWGYQSPMTLDQIRIFVAVAEHGHVTRAARELGLTQSAASAAIGALEARYKAKLFDRVGRGIRLSETGRRFLPEARRVLQGAAAARSVLEDLSGVAAGRLSVAASQTIANYWLPRRLAAFQTDFPSVQVDVVIGNTSQVESAVVGCAAELGLVEGATQHLALTREQVDWDRLVLVAPSRSSSLPKNASGRVDLRELSWVVREPGSGTRAVLEDLAHGAGLSLHDLRISLVLPSNEAVREAVEAGAGATIISEHVVARAIAAGVLQAIPMELPLREFALVRHTSRDASRAQRALVRFLQTFQRDAEGR